MFIRLLFVVLSICGLALAQNGDKAGEAQVDPIPADKIPPSPPLTPEESLKAFKLPPGFHIELVASEPMIEAPVTMSFDGSGRLWVLEMRGFMRTPEGGGEDELTGVISILEDTDGDGRMDKKTVFQDGLRLPRALMLFRDGALVAEPPKLWFFRDKDGDLKADEKIEVASDYGSRENPEHTSNSLTWALDNWIYSANHTTRFRNVDGNWQREPTVFRGQWGLTQDDFGRLFYNSNSDQLRGDMVPSPYLARNPHLRGGFGLNVQLIRSQAVWPARMNPGVNRGYQRGQLRADGTLATFTGACGPVIYRGDNFPTEFEGNAFLCEPTGNLVRRTVLNEKEGIITASNPYDKTEFLTSTDEWFRPVNLFNAPDGALYVVDMHRGIIQHRIYLTSYLRKQALSRGLEKKLDMGRIYRVVHEGKAPGPKPQLERASAAGLVAALSHPNGWWRDTAQRLLVERRDPAATAPLRELAKSGENPLGRLHALWTLDGLGQIDKDTILDALADSHPKVAAAAIRLSEGLLKTEASAAIWPKLVAKAASPNFDEQLQLMFTLGEVKTDDAENLMGDILIKKMGNPLLQTAALSGLGGREWEFFTRVKDKEDWKRNATVNRDFLNDLATCVFQEGNAAHVDAMLAFAADDSALDWQRNALLNGIASLAPKPNAGKQGVKPRTLRLKEEPPALAALRKSAATEVKDRLAAIDRIAAIESLLVWPGKAGTENEKPVTPLTKEQQEQFDKGKELYLATCGACHQPTGLGQEGLAPPLLDSTWSLGPEARLIRIVLHGVRGKIAVKDKVFEMEMPPLGVLDDEQIANALTYIRREWGHTASPVSKEAVAKIRAQTEQRLEAWTEPELLKIP